MRYALPRTINNNWKRCVAKIMMGLGGFRDAESAFVTSKLHLCAWLLRAR